MKRTIHIIFFFFILLSGLQSVGQESPSNEKYSYKKADPNGIGKWYLGREIAHVMGFQGMSWLERPEREKEENTSLLLDNMNIQPQDIIADIGAGSGYHVFKMVEIAVLGQLYAVDIQDEMLEAIQQKKESLGLQNITTVKGSEDDVKLLANTIDKVLMVDVYHEFNFPFEIMASVHSALKPKGKLYLIEYRGEDDSVPIKKLHKLTEAQAVKEMKAAGFILEENKANLPWQHCMIFTKD